MINITQNHLRTDVVYVHYRGPLIADRASRSPAVMHMNEELDSPTVVNQLSFSTCMMQILQVFLQFNTKHLTWLYSGFGCDCRYYPNTIDFLDVITYHCYFRLAV